MAKKDQDVAAVEAEEVEEAVEATEGASENGEQLAAGHVRLGAGKTLENGESLRVEFVFNVGENLADATEMYGEDIVFSRYKRAVIRDHNNAIRSAISKHDKDGNTPELIKGIVEEELADWRPDVERERTPSTQSIENRFDKLSAEAQEALLQKLMAKSGYQVEEAA